MYVLQSVRLPCSSAPLPDPFGGIQGHPMLYRTTCSAVLGTYPGSAPARRSVAVIFEADEVAEAPEYVWRNAVALIWQVEPDTVHITEVQDGATLAAASGTPTADGIYRGVLGLPGDHGSDSALRTPPEFPLCLTRPHIQTQLWMVWSNHVLRSWPLPWQQGELYAIHDACMRELRRYLKTGDPGATSSRMASSRIYGPSYSSYSTYCSVHAWMSPIAMRQVRAHRCTHWPPRWRPLRRRALIPGRPSPPYSAIHTEGRTHE